MSLVTLQVVQHLRPGGIEHLVLNLLRFASPGYQQFVVALEGSKEEAITQWPELKPFAERLFFLNKPKGKSPLTVIKLRQLMLELGVKVVHSHHIGPLLYSRLAALGLKVRHIQTEHDSWHLSNPRHQQLTRWLLNSAKVQLVADAPRVALQLEKLLGRPADHVILNGIDTEYFSPGSRLLARQDLQLPLDKILIGCAGRLVHEKGIDNALHALASLPNNHHLVIAGQGDKLDELQSLAQHLQLEHRVHWLGYCDQMRLFYRALDLFTMPSRQEGLPLALLEAQACGKSVVATQIGGIPDLLHPHSGKLIKPDRPDQLASAIRDVLAQSNEVSRHNSEFVRECADIRTMAIRYEAIAF
ncbi:glycosyltransferase [Photobacterium jeanii]|uniref:Glycosyltransferase n=1 Tax=Photobacterium jeanii TaxID=858640 RepID=A0A178KJ78_9GAMM|nr:glycosyltransferase [Photobacterium jeanii]OAN16813.1 glycosyltransferase [Photobacterium jeanii]PST88422.1 glycosyltransferase family 1 protein [Photobacterium jeanii]